MTKSTEHFLSADGRTQIAYTVWAPEGQPRGILQIAHGMVEFIDRYDRFATVLTNAGWLVAGNDHLGHGASVTDESKLGYFAPGHGEEAVLQDLHTLRTLLTKQWPSVPYCILGHSMGSFMVRAYLQEHGEGIAAAIIMGTGSQPGPVPALGRCICRVLAACKGWEYRSGFVNNMALGSYNKRFEPARTRNDWLTRDEAIVDAYNANPLNNFVFTLNGFDGLFAAIGKAQNKKRLACIPKALPVLLVSGAEDPVGSFGAGVKQACEGLKAAGLTDVTMKLYPDCRHEILNELNREAVDADLLAWLNDKTEGTRA